MSKARVNMTIAKVNELVENHPISDSRFMAISTFFRNDLIQRKEWALPISREKAIEAVKIELGMMTDEEFENLLIVRDIQENINIAISTLPIKDWYDNNYPSDRDNNISKDANFILLMACLDNGIDLDTIGVDDSVIRERLFQGLCEIIDCDYDFIYNKWRNGKDVNLKLSYNVEITDYAKC